MKNELSFKFLKDIPHDISDGSTVDFYHGQIAPAFKQILENETCVHTVGLFGKWGTGKSTLIEIIRKDLDLPFFTFDAWKYQEDSLRRSFLIELTAFLIDKGFLPKNYQKKINSLLYKATEQSTEVSDDETQPGTLKGFITFLTKSLPYFLILTGITITVLSDESNLLAKIVSQVTSIFGGLLFLKPLFEQVTKRIVDDFWQIIYPVAKLRKQIEYEERYNSPEQFEKVFKNILQKVNRRMVIVIDNIDRVQGDTAITMLSTIKTFLDPLIIISPIFIIPCDSGAISNQLEAYYGDDESNYDTTEYLRKLFNVTIWTPEFIQTDFLDFISKTIEKTGEIQEYINTEDVRFVIKTAFPNNPREIKQFINNLIAMLVLASKTEVWKHIKSEIAYFTKVLVLRQKFPEGFTQLKEKWYDPESIDTSKSSELRNFMINTGRITVSNAQPFLYLKQPTLHTGINNVELIISSLADSNNEKFKKLVSGNKRANLFTFLENLFDDYKNQKPILHKMFVTQLQVFNELHIVNPKRAFYERMALLINNELWEYFDRIPVDLVFSDIIDQLVIGSSYQEMLIERYLSVLELPQLHTESDTKLAKTIFAEFKIHYRLLNQRHLELIQQAIDQHYVNSGDTLALYDTQELQQLFLTRGILEKFISSIDQKNISNKFYLLDILKPFIIKQSLLSIIFQKITELANYYADTITENTLERNHFFEIIDKINSIYLEDFSAIDPITQLSLFACYKRIFTILVDWDEKVIVAKTLYQLQLTLPNEHTEEIRAILQQLLANVSIKKLNELIRNFDNRLLASFITQSITQLINRCSNANDSGEFFTTLYMNSNKSEQVQLLNHYINTSNPFNLSFIDTLKGDLPDKQLIFESLINKASNLPLSERTEIYKYLSQHISKDDAESIKSLLSDVISALIMSTDSHEQEVGYNLFTESTFLSIENKRELAKNIMDWLRTPNKVVTSSDYYAMKTIFDLRGKVQSTLLTDYIYVLFNMLQRDSSDTTIKTSLDLLSQLRPSYHIYQKDYKDLITRLKNSENIDSRRTILSEILTRVLPPKSNRDFIDQITDELKLLTLSPNI